MNKAFISVLEKMLYYDEERKVIKPFKKTPNKKMTKKYHTENIEALLSQ